MERLFAPSRLAILFTLMALCAWSPRAQAQDLSIHSKDELIGPSLYGLSGGLRTFSAQRAYGGEPGFQFGFRGEYFALENFFTSGDSIRRMGFNFAANFVPCKWSEIAFTWNGFTNLGGTSASSIDQLGNFTFSTKIGHDISKLIALSAAFRAEYLNSFDDLDLSGKAWNFAPMALMTFDFVRSDNVPLRLHLNAGYRIDSSTDLVGTGSVTTAERFYMRVFPGNQIIGGVGIEIPVDFATMIAEYTTEQALGTGSGTFRENPQRVTLGLRIFPTSNRQIALDAAADIGLFNTAPATDPVAEPTWNIIFGFTYSALPERKKQPKKLASIDGLIVDADTQKPLGDATIVIPEMNDKRLLSSPETGKFMIGDLEPGTVLIRVEKEGYQPLSTQVEITSAGVVTSQIALQKKAAPKESGTFFLKLTDADRKPIQGELRFPELPKQQAFTIPPRGLGLKLPARDYTIVVSAPNYLAEEHVVTIEPNTKVVTDFKLREKSARVALVKEKIVIRDTIQFQTGKWIIRTESFGILNRVADLIQDNPQITRLRVEGHTDSTGKLSFNNLLSQKRAESVLAYLVAQGIDRKRLIAQGFGPSQPIASNATRDGRAQNRRVEFTVIESNPNVGAQGARNQAPPPPVETTSEPMPEEPVPAP